jgi:molecular chaperone GrpE
MDDRHGIPGYTVRDRRWWARDEGDERGGDAAGGDKPSYVAQLEAEIAERDRRLSDALVRLRQAQEEQELARHRIERDARREIARSKKEVLAAIVPVLDDLDRARAAAEGGGGVDALRRGIELVQSGFLDRLRSLGVDRDIPTGQPFDPSRHEAVSVAPGGVDGSVAATVSPGYLLEGEVLRAARVVVTRADTSSQNVYPGSGN